jgi:hypothetical protein
MNNGPSTSSGPPGNENLSEIVRASLAQTVRTNRKSREEIALGLSARLGASITKTMLDAWTAESRPGHRFPLEYLPAWIRETGDYSLLKIICEELGLAVPEPGQTDMIAFARARLEADLAGAEAAGLKAKILGHRSTEAQR